jgi:PKD repeat protein
VAYEPAIDIGNPTVELSGSTYVSLTGQVYQQHNFEIPPPTISEWAENRPYLSFTTQIYHSHNVVIPPPTVEVFGTPYLRVPDTFVYKPTDIIRIFALPTKPGDDGILIVFDLERPLVAGFDAEPMSGDAPLRVQFTDTSEGGPTGWLWVFGDGTTSTLRNPLHEFEFPGLYPVTLTVSGPNQRKDSTGKVIYVRFPLGMGGGILMVPINIMKCLAFGAVNSPGGPKDGLKTFLRMFNRSDYTDQVLE